MWVTMRAGLIICMDKQCIIYLLISSVRGELARYGDLWLPS